MSESRWTSAAIDVCAAVELLAQAYEAESDGDVERGVELREQIRDLVPEGRHRSDVCGMALSALVHLTGESPDRLITALGIDLALRAQLDAMAEGAP